MEWKELMEHPLHPHPRAEEDCSLSNHVIVDLQAWVNFTGIPYKGKYPELEKEKQDETTKEMSN